MPKDYLDHQSLSARYTYNAIPYTKVKHLVYEKKTKMNISYRESFDENMKTINLGYARRINLKQQVDFPDSISVVPYKSVPISDKKKKHLLEMILFMSEEERDFILNSEN
ncbi:hypothetical protein HHI36_014383 [Cryptolaemus montrouzieri]|uniref:Uncharacterized protein n=1 Tax=Cryptolaemus montrouzieri TaxID=559131 RepID=A0ABD2N2Q2_9CUCU